VALAVEGEGVDAQPLAGRARLDAGQADAPDSELAEQLQQGTGAVADDGDQRGLVVAGGLGQRAGRRHEDEPGDRARMVGDVLDQRRESVALPRDRRTDGGVELAGGDGGRRRRGRRRRQRRDPGQVRRQPPRGLRQGVRMARHGPDLVQRDPLAGHQGHRHGEEHLTGDHHRFAVGQAVHRGGHRALDGVLQRNECGVGLPRSDGGQCGGHAGGG